MIISGDISVEMTDADSNMEINARRYYLSNKIFYSFKVDNQNNFGLKLVKLKVETKIKTAIITVILIPKKIWDKKEKNKEMIYKKSYI